MSEAAPSPEAVIPIMEEEARVERTVVETGAVRVRVRTASRTQVIDEPVLMQSMRVERVPCRRFVEERSASWTEGDVIVVPVYEEVMVKRTLLVEEIRLTPTFSLRREPQGIALESETAVFERQRPDGSWQEIPIPDKQPPRTP